jgi:alpha-tubulin suppressor-like RCC1 family protein
VAIGSNKIFCEISTKNHTGFGIDNTGLVWGWGQNYQGQLGINSTSHKCTPTSLLGNRKTFCKIAAGISHTLAIEYSGRAWAWGYNLTCQLGDFSSTNRSTPVSVFGNRTFCEIAASDGHSLAIDKNGKIWSWGLNTSGELGVKSITSKRIPVSVFGGTKTFCFIDANTTLSGAYSLSLDKNGGMWAWGKNDWGLLGDNSLIDKSSPVAVFGNHTFCKIVAGGVHVLAVDKNGQVWAWGTNEGGQLGNNETSASFKCTPISIHGNPKTFCNVFAGKEHSLAIDKNNRLWVWGDGAYGALGLNSQVSKSTPMMVSYV